MASGDLLVEVKDKSQYQKLTNLVAFGDQPITVTAHSTMNTVKGVVSDDDLMDLTDELLAGWKDENVVQVQRIKIRRDNREILTRHIIVTFNSSTLPDEIETGYLKLHVRPYIPNTRRCFKCQRFGHASQSCRGQLTCAKCSAKGHSADDDCNAEAHCANCDGDHPAYSRSCTAWRKKIIIIKYKENISFCEARQRLSPYLAKKSSFAEVVQRGPAPQRHQAAVQATRSVLRRPPLAPTVGAATAALPSPNVATLEASPRPGTSRDSSEAKEVLPTSSLVGSKASFAKTKPTQRHHRSLEQLSDVSHEAMDTTSSPAVQAAPKERRDTLDRSKKSKTPITGPEKGPVK
ncbi:uncharacterized protein LOC119391800 [Rhipicephalus sanguineus]|uniref:uncharacterized protein LOC119391800 n=1 Tax=Rhipicephalus sanguineus TaxID=34632 RepID=UPI00189445E3|nr:uncharacterized protein LOC119391800 [Rhipicephalus sanguineus]